MPLARNFDQATAKTVSLAMVNRPSLTGNETITVKIARIVNIRLIDNINVNNLVYSQGANCRSVVALEIVKGYDSRYEKWRMNDSTSE
jgi:hypothetical protein